MADPNMGPLWNGNGWRQVTLSKASKCRHIFEHFPMWRQYKFWNCVPTSTCHGGKNDSCTFKSAKISMVRRVTAAWQHTYDNHFPRFNLIHSAKVGIHPTDFLLLPCVTWNPAGRGVMLLSSPYGELRQYMQYFSTDFSSLFGLWQKKTCRLSQKKALLFDSWLSLWMHSPDLLSTHSAHG